MGKIIGIIALGIGIIALLRGVRAEPSSRGNKWESAGTEPSEDGDEEAGDQYLNTLTGDVYQFS